MKKASRKSRQILNGKNLGKFLSPLGQCGDIEEMINDFDWHGRKIFFKPYFRALLLYQMDESKNMTDWHHAILKDSMYKFARARMDVSLPALSMANATKSPEIFAEILGHLMAYISKLPNSKKIERELPDERLKQIQDLLVRTQIFDSTTWELSSKLSSWAKYSEDQAGVRVHIKLEAGYAGIKQLIITTAKDNDSKHFQSLLNLEKNADQIYIYDCGYHKISTYEKIRRSGNHLVTTFPGSISYEIKEDLSMEKTTLESGYTISSDQRVSIGKEELKTEPVYRLLCGTDAYGNEYKILTDIFELSADQICLLKMYRWTIEIVFRWLKHALKLKRFMSTSLNGITIQLLVALIFYCLVCIFYAGQKLSFVSLMRELRVTSHWLMWHAGYQACLDDLEKKGKARFKRNHTYRSLPEKII